MKAIKLNKLDTFFVKSIIDSKLVIKLPKYKLVFLLSLLKQNAPLQSVNIGFPLEWPYFGPKCTKLHHDQSY